MKIKVFITQFLLASVFFTLSAQSVPVRWPKKMVVAVPVADLRHAPGVIHHSLGERDLSQLTQVLFGECIEVLERQDDWLKIRAHEQKILLNNELAPCPGWIRANQAVEVAQYPEPNLVVTKPWAHIYTQLGKDNKKVYVPVSIGTKLVGTLFCEGIYKIELPWGKLGLLKATEVKECSFLKTIKEECLRKNIIHTAETFIGGPYFWGGRSFYNPEIKNQATSTDCSGYIQLCFGANGIDVPRNSRAQYFACSKLKEKPNVCDLIFLAASTPSTIQHVMLFTGDDMLFEARGEKSVRKIRKISGVERLGKPIEQLKSGEKTPAGVVYFGSYLRR